jgi:hypothetical protein
MMNHGHDWGSDNRFAFDEQNKNDNDPRPTVLSISREVCYSMHFHAAISSKVGAGWSHPLKISAP